MAQHTALFPVYRYIDMLFEDHLLQIPQNAAQAVAETEQIVSHLHAEPVVPAHGKNGHASGFFRCPARAVAAAVALRKPTEFFHRCLTLADAGKTPISAHRHTPQDGRAYAHAVHRVFGVFQKPGGVQHMRHAGVAALGVQLVQNALKRLGLRDGCFLIAECRVQMGIDAGHMQARHVFEDRQQLIQFVRQKAVAAHAGVDLDVHLRLHAKFFCYAVQDCRVILARNGQNRAEVQQLRQLVRVGGRAEHQNVTILKPARAQTADLGKFRHGEVRDT